MFAPPCDATAVPRNPLVFTDSSCRLHRETGKILRDCIRKIGTLTPLRAVVARNAADPARALGGHPELTTKLLRAIFVRDGKYRTRTWERQSAGSPAYRDRVLTLPLSYRLLDLAVICITSSGGIHRGADRNHDS
jgi:hypothetical protein